MESTRCRFPSCRVLLVLLRLLELMVYARWSAFVWWASSDLMRR